MPKELNEFPDTGRGRPNKYPWDEWLSDGKIRQFDLGTDFKSKPENFRSSAIAEARKRGIKVRTALVNDKKSVVIQAVQPDTKGV